MLASEENRQFSITKRDTRVRYVDQSTWRVFTFMFCHRRLAMPPLRRDVKARVKDTLMEREWAVRGQGNAAWDLETGLGRAGKLDSRDNREKASLLRRFECESLWEFRREIRKIHEFRGIEGLDLLSLVQHYEGKTRLLDFTMAPLLAMYMAHDSSNADYSKVKSHLAALEKAGYDVEINVSSDNKKMFSGLEQPAFAVWAINLNRICKFVSGKDNEKWNTVDGILAKAERILKSKYEMVADSERAAVEEARRGVSVIFPRTSNDRLSAQEGLFLMPHSLACSFNENLRATLGYPEDILKTQLLSALNAEEVATCCPVVKFVFPPFLCQSVKRLLEETNVVPRKVYPDLTGLGRQISGLIQDHVDLFDLSNE